VTIGDEIVSPRTMSKVRRHVAMVFQSPLLFDVSVLANASSGLRFRGVPRREAEERARRWLERFSVAHLERRGVRGLSAGEAQRVSLARAFATEPNVMLLDEPFAAVDAPSRASLLPEVAEVLRASGASAILVTHHLAEARVMADRVAVMFAGRIVQVGSMEELLTSPANAEVEAFFRFSRLSAM
jgi:tungstate transport system ATP-binding protein